MLKKKYVFTFFFSTSRFLDKRPGIQNGRVWVFILETKQVQLPLWFLFSSRTWQLKLGGGPAWICKKKKKSCSQPKTPTRAWSAAKKKERGAARTVERRWWGEKERRETQRETQTHGAATDPQTDATSRQVNYAAVGIRSHSLRRVRRVRTTRNFHPPNLANFYARTSGVKTLWWWQKCCSILCSHVRVTQSSSTARF